MPGLIKLLTNTESTVLNIKSQLYLNDVSSITKNSFQSGISDSTDDAFLELYIDSDDKEKAEKIISKMGISL